MIWHKPKTLDVKCTLWSLPRFPIKVPRAEVAISSPVGVTLFWWGMNECSNHQIAFSLILITLLPFFHGHLCSRITQVFVKPGQIPLHLGSAVVILWQPVPFTRVNDKFSIDIKIMLQRAIEAGESAAKGFKAYELQIKNKLREFLSGNYC